MHVHSRVIYSVSAGVAHVCSEIWVVCVNDRHFSTSRIWICIAPNHICIRLRGERGEGRGRGERGEGEGRGNALASVLFTRGIPSADPHHILSQ